MSDLVPGLAYAEFVQEAWRHRKETAFQASPFFERHRAAIERILSTPVIHKGRRESAGTPAEGRDPLRVVHWNIEKGKKLEGIRDFLSRDTAVSGASVFCLNEVDDGMARTNNADVASVLARELACDAVFVPNYIECTKGLPSERSSPGDNERGLHGIAILSRLPILETHVEILPPCWDYFDFHEKRVGGRRGLYLLLDRGDFRVIVATAHLEMRGNPACRARQFQAFLEGLAVCEARWGGRQPAILTGDWNTHTFRRGGRLNTGREYVRIVGTHRSRMDADLVRPFELEPLFGHLSRAGFSLEGANDESATAFQSLDTVEDLTLLPEWLGKTLVRMSGLKGRVLRMRLDWIASRDLEVAGPPLTTWPVGVQGEPLSDHALIAADFR